METILAAVITGFVALFTTLLLLHAQNRKDAKARAEVEQARAEEELERDNKLAFLLENFPPHRHSSHQGISYPAGMHPGRNQD